jgi:hypothetical protein
LILVYGVGDGQAVGFCGLGEGSHEKEQRQRGSELYSKSGP